MATDSRQSFSKRAPGLPTGLDAIAVGMSIFGAGRPPEAPLVEGCADVEFLAEGGLGHVWRATRRSDGRSVALKAPQRMDPETIERIAREAEALQSIDHPNIVKLIELTESDAGAPILVMELVDGPNLTQRLPANGFDFDHALQLFLPVLDAVEHAHRRGLIHRDLKPSNILLDADGRPKVSDFGLATSVKDRQLAFSLTRSGVVAGTVEYLAPECYEPDGEPSPATDVFALGVIFYEILTGRPPRGAWPRLSEVKRLDIRLDDLLAAAIHPDPAQRLGSAAEFASRLVEIRDSQPRYAGAPMVNRSTRIADALWTVGGLYCLGASFCSLLKINNTAVPRVFDLTFGHARLLGGYWALWVLCVAMGVLWLWQTLRLWRFRQVSLREALPSPFGLRLGHGRGAAIVVGFGQLLCAWAPLVYGGWIFSQCWYWATPESAPWENVLAVTRWGSDQPVSAWTWDVAGMFSADEFWIRQMRPGQSPGEWILVDRQSFFVVTQPLAMVLGVSAIGVGMGATLMAAAAGWLPRRAARFAVLVGAIVAAIASVGATRQTEARNAIKAPDDPADWLGRRMAQRASTDALPAAMALFDGASGREPWDETKLDHWIAMWCAERVLCDGAVLSRDEFRSRLAAFIRPSGGNHVVEAQSTPTIDRPLQDPTTFRVRIHGECYGGWPDGSCRGRYLQLSASGRFPGPADGLAAVRPVFDEWESVATELYEAASVPLTPAASRDWMHGFLKCLSEPGCPGLEGYFLPVILAPRTNERDVYAPAPSSRMVGFLRSSASRGFAFSLLEPSSWEPSRRAGGRIVLTFAVGISRKGKVRASSSQWTVELVFSGDAWKILRLQM